MSIVRPEPIDEEVVWDKKRTIKSRTNTKGVIEYANKTFIEVCGYSREELLGTPHNIIRHPDMPKVLFKELWNNINQSKNFNAVVKNLSKSGRYYWVVTNFDIYKDNVGMPVSFLALRNAVPEPIVKELTPIYQELLDIEKVEDVKASSQYLKENILADYDGSYDKYIKMLFAQNGVDVSFW